MFQRRRVPNATGAQKREAAGGGEAAGCDSHMVTVTPTTRVLILRSKGSDFEQGRARFGAGSAPFGVDTAPWRGREHAEGSAHPNVGSPRGGHRGHWGSDKSVGCGGNSAATNKGKTFWGKETPEPRPSAVNGLGVPRGGPGLQARVGESGEQRREEGWGMSGAASTCGVPSDGLCFGAE